MSLAHPALSLMGKKKGKVKYKSAEAKREAEKLAEQWNNIKTKHKPMTEKKVFKTWEYTLSAPPGRSTSNHIPSRGDGLGNAAAKETKVYTGTEMVGISIIHKSCLQPVFSQEAATDAANMRR
jgi:hypothetical protein